MKRVNVPIIKQTCYQPMATSLTTCQHSPYDIVCKLFGIDGNIKNFWYHVSYSQQLNNGKSDVVETIVYIAINLILNALLKVFHVFSSEVD